jgi:Circularly permuted ATP-grasp type 2/Transglutaminase-like superfamily
MASVPSKMPLQGLFGDYQVGPFYEEMFAAQEQTRPHYSKIFEKLASMVPSQFEERRQHADLSFLLQGITFTVYSDGRGTERLFPFDLIPRIIPNSEWQRIDRGLAQRVVALNLFLQDVYGKQRIFADRQIPRSLVIGGYASHAWAEVYLPDSGWMGLDPTLGKPLGLQHVRVAYGRDYGDVAPVRGVYKGHAGQRLSVDVRVRPEVDDGGREQLNENKVSSPEPAVVLERVQQPAQQQ